MKPISGKSFCRLLEDSGWILKRINGSHHIYARAGILSEMISTGIEIA